MMSGVDDSGSIIRGTSVCFPARAGGLGARLRRLRQRMCANARGRVAVALAEDAVKVRHIAEAGVERDRADLLGRATRVGQQAVRAGEALRQHIVGEARALVLEQPLDAARRAAVANGKRGDRQVGLIEIPRDVLLEGVQPRRAQAAALCDLGGIARRTECDGHQVIEMRHHRGLQIAIGQCPPLRRDIEIARQQSEREIVMRDAAQEGVSAGEARRQLRPRKAQHEKIARGTVRGNQGVGQRHQRGFAVAEHDLAPALREEMGAARVDDHADVVGRIGADARAPVTRALHPAGQKLQSGRRIERQIDLDRIADRLGVVADAQTVEELGEQQRTLVFGRGIGREAQRSGRGRPRAVMHAGNRRREAARCVSAGHAATARRATARIADGVSP